MKMGTTTFFIVEKLGFRGILVLLGSLHVYLEFLAALLAIEGFFKFYVPLFKTLKDKDINKFKNSFLNDFLLLLLRIFLLLAAAAL